MCSVEARVIVVEDLEQGKELVATIPRLEKLKLQELGL